MDKQQDLVQEAVKEQHNTTSNELDLEPQKLPLNAESKPTQIASNEICTEQPNVQNNNKTPSSEIISKSDLTESKKLNVDNKSQAPQESAKETSAPEVQPKSKKAKQRLRKGKWTVSAAPACINLSPFVTYLINHVVSFLDRRRRVYIEDNPVLQYRTPHFARRSNSTLLSSRKVELRSDANH